jgi:hypothetical protein
MRPSRSNTGGLASEPPSPSVYCTPHVAECIQQERSREINKARATPVYITGAGAGLDISRDCRNCARYSNARISASAWLRLFATSLTT